MTMVLETKSLRSRRGQRSPRIGPPEIDRRLEDMNQQSIAPVAKRSPMLPFAVALLAAVAYGAGIITTALVAPNFNPTTSVGHAADHADDPDPSHHGRPEPVLIRVMPSPDDRVAGWTPTGSPSGSFRGARGSLAVALVIAGAVAYPVNRWLISRGKGHALVHGAHGGAAR
jgi:hypothetical protein